MHNKVYGICESKCKVEVPKKTDMLYEINEIYKKINGKLIAKSLSEIGIITTPTSLGQVKLAMNKSEYDILICENEDSNTSHTLNPKGVEHINLIIIGNIALCVDDNGNLYWRYMWGTEFGGNKNNEILSYGSTDWTKLNYKLTNNQIPVGGMYFDSSKISTSQVTSKLGYGTWNYFGDLINSTSKIAVHAYVRLK